MSLTVALDQPDSTTNAFFDAHLPHHERLTVPWARALRSKRARCSTSDPRIAQRAGSAIEIRIGCDLAVLFPYEVLAAALGATGDSSALAAMGFQPPSGQPDAELRRWLRTGETVTALDLNNIDRKLQALHYCWHMAYIDDVRHALAKTDLTDEYLPLLWQMAPKNPVPDEATNTLIGLWQNYLRYGRQQLAALGAQVVIRPSFAERFAVGDLLLGGTLVEIKYSNDPEASLTRCLRQVVGCALTDFDDEYQITKVGVYHAREGHLVTWPLAGLVDAMAAAPLPLAALRASFAGVVGTERAAIASRRDGIRLRYP